MCHHVFQQTWQLSAVSDMFCHAASSTSILTISFVPTQDDKTTEALSIALYLTQYFRK